MNQMSAVNPEPFFLEGDARAILLIHGFTGSPAEMRPIADYLHARGMTVSAPLLPGHGTSPDDLNRQRREDFLRYVDDELSALIPYHYPIFVAGLSFGSLLALHLAAQRPSLAGAVVYSPPLKVTDKRQFLLPLFKHVIAQVPAPEIAYVDPKAHDRMWHYDVYPTRAAHEVVKFRRQTETLLPLVRCPLLIVHSTRDTIIEPDSARTVYDLAGSEDKQIVALTNSSHVITVDGEWATVAKHTYAFVESHGTPAV